jgi:hypothetical protein
MELGIVEQQRQQARLKFLAELGDPANSGDSVASSTPRSLSSRRFARSSRTARNSS